MPAHLPEVVQEPEGRSQEDPPPMKKYKNPLWLLLVIFALALPLLIFPTPAQPSPIKICTIKATSTITGECDAGILNFFNMYADIPRTRGCINEAVRAALPQEGPAGRAVLAGSSS